MRPLRAVLLAAAFTAAAMLAVAFAAQSSHGADSPQLDFTLTPALEADVQTVNAVDVAMRIRGVHVLAGKPLLQLPIVIYNVETVAKSLVDLSVADDRGPLHLSTRDDEPGGQEFNRHWLADREVMGLITVRYRAPISNRLSPLGGAPPTELRAEGASLSAGGATFLTLPASSDKFQVTVRWDLSKLPSGSVALSSFGANDTSSTEPVALGAVSNSFFMAGQVGRFPKPLPSNGFMSAWQSKPAFDASALMAWTKQLHDHYAVFFHEKTPKPYVVFLRPNPVNPGGGIGQNHSFVATFDAHVTEGDLKFTLAHEMLHTYIGGLNGDENMADGWFSEGLAVYYQRMLPWRFGLMSSEDFLADLNKTAGRYYTDALANTPNGDIAANFWSNTLIRVLPYDRGALYFAAVNDEVRKASHGKRSLDDLVFAMLKRRDQSGNIQRSDWESVLRAELGQPGIDGFTAMLLGQQVLPASDAFGPCFERTQNPLRRYELGFDPKVMAERKRIVRGLIPGSAAAQAGLRDGDEILKPFGQDTVQEDQTKTITIHLKRDGKESEITYLPRGETVQAYQWRHAGNASTSDCGA